MAQYIPFAPKVQVLGTTVLSFVNALKVATIRKDMLQTLSRHGITDPTLEDWYSQASWLNAFKEIGEKYGATTLFAIGKAIPENAMFPPEIDSLQKGLAAIDVAYHMNHRGGEIGYYKLLEFHEGTKTALMECKNPYPSEFDRGIISAMAHKFRPMDILVIDVELDKNSPTRLNGADSCRFKISW
jgi:hypothetical protein